MYCCESGAKPADALWATNSGEEVEPARRERGGRFHVALNDEQTGFFMMVTLIGMGSGTLLEDFDAAEVEYARRLPQPDADPSAAQVVEMREFSVPTVARIIVAWLEARTSRKVTITRKDDTTWHARGRSVAEVEELLTGSKNMLALETETDEPDAGKNETGTPGQAL